MQNPKNFLESQQNLSKQPESLQTKFRQASPFENSQNLFNPPFTQFGEANRLRQHFPEAELSNARKFAGETANRPSSNRLSDPTALSQSIGNPLNSRANHSDRAPVQNFLAINNINNKIIIQANQKDSQKDPLFNEFIKFNDENKKVNEFRKNMKLLLKSDLSKQTILDFISQNSILNPGVSGAYSNLGALQSNMKQFRLNSQRGPLQDPHIARKLGKRPKLESKVFFLRVLDAFFVVNFFYLILLK